MIEEPEANDWVEMGTGHQCDSFRYWFWAYAINRVFYSLGTESGVPWGVSHYFKLYRLSYDGKAWWHYELDNTLKRQVNWNIAGYRVAAGLESYDAHADVVSHTYRELQETFDEGPWYYWSANYRQSWVDPGMCGGWVSQTEWKAAQSNPC
ncbi:MAG: hypothetical protein ACRDF0_07940 [Candidatus Limnocylindria bacterium]